MARHLICCQCRVRSVSLTCVGEEIARLMIGAMSQQLNVDVVMSWERNLKMSRQRREDMEGIHGSSAGPRSC